LLHKKNFYCVDHTPDEVRSFKEWVNLFLFTIFSSGMIYVSERNKNNKIFSVLKFFNSKFKIIRNGIDTNKFKRKKKILQKKKIIIGMAARFVKEKKQSLIIDTFINNKQYFCEKNIALSFAGSGDLLNSQKKKVQENNLSSFIKFKGNLNEKNLIKWFNEIDIYFHLSDAETTSTAILQALSNSLPIYASKVQGNIQISKFIGKKYIKLITNNKKSLKNAIMSLINNRNYFINISKLMKKNVNNKISLNNISKKYLDFITS
jgi:glycosyltransferase involved in cell wall biosynthesis